MIVDAKNLWPPPPYAGMSPSTRSSSDITVAFSELPSHLLLQIVYSTFPQSDGKYEGEGKLERQRQTLHWLHTSLRLVNRALYIACMHVLRSTYLPAYDSLVRPPYTSDPFPASSSFSTSVTSSTHRELFTLDLFIAILAHEDVLLDATSLHLPREEAYKDLFDRIQPRSRLEDLVALYGRRRNVVFIGEWELSSTVPASAPAQKPLTSKESHPYSCSPPPSSSSLLTQASTATLTSVAGPSRLPRKPSFFSFPSLGMNGPKGKGKGSENTPPVFPFSRPPRRITPLPFSSLSVSFSPRKVGLIYTPPPPPTPSRSHNGSTTTVTGSLFATSSVISVPLSGGRKRTLVEVSRTREDSLEITAQLLVQALKDWLQGEAELL